MGKNKEEKERSLFFMIAKPVIIFMIPTILVMSFLPGPSGKPLMSFSDWLPSKDSFKPIISLLEKSGIDARFLNALLPDSKKVMYRWKDRDGKWQLSEVVPDYAKHTAVLQTEDGEGIFGGEAATAIYQWKDDKGGINFTEYAKIPDYARASAKQTVINASDVNTVQMPKPKEEDKSSNDNSSGMPFPTTIDPSKIKDLVEDAQQVQQTLEERNKQMENY